MSRPHSHLGKLIYKCRNCGEVNSPYGVPDVIKAMVALTSDGFFQHDRTDRVITIKDVHHCAVGTWGVNDLIGAKED